LGHKAERILPRQERIITVNLEQPLTGGQICSFQNVRDQFLMFIDRDLGFEPRQARTRHRKEEILR
jgi:hypothetical protein